jgi:hypothetical protein
MHVWSHDWDLNPGPLPYHGSALPLSYRGTITFPILPVVRRSFKINVGWIVYPYSLAALFFSAVLLIWKGLFSGGMITSWVGIILLRIFLSFGNPVGKR